jgi:hypothetical protein
MTTYGGIVRFGDYNLPNLGRFTCDFAMQQTQMVPLPGMDGGFDMYGDDPAPFAPGGGNVTQDIKVISSDRAGMDALRDAVKLMSSYGLARLVYQPTESTDQVRWTWARLVSPNMVEDKGWQTDLWQPVTLTFICPEPVWWVDTHVGWSIGDGSKIGDLALTIGEGGHEILASGVSSTDTLDNDGNTKSIPQIVVVPQVGDSCENPTIQRLIGTLVVDEVVYTGTLSAGDTLSINGKTGAITVNGSSDWANISYEHRDFLRLLPGENSIKVVFANAGDAATVTFYYRDSYR